MVRKWRQVIKASVTYLKQLFVSYDFYNSCHSMDAAHLIKLCFVEREPDGVGQLLIDFFVDFSRR